MLKQWILEDLQKAVQDLGFPPTDMVCNIPQNAAFGDYSTNVALQLAKLKVGQGKQTSEEIAKQIVTRVKSQQSSQEYLEKIEIVGGFINFFIREEKFLENLHQVCNYSLLVNPEVRVENEEKKKILIEYAHPNTHKAFHIGHTRNISLGESITRLLEATGHEVFRANYQGDIGLHVAKALWGVSKLGSSKINQAKTLAEKAELLGKAYATGVSAYEDNEAIKNKIQDINQKLYAKDSKILPLWEKTRQISLDYFESIYQKLGTKFDRLFFESEVEEQGKKIVQDNLGKIFAEDQGAVIFRGEDYGLHNRVFITSAGHPTYEAKDLGLAYLERSTFSFDLALHLVGTDQSGYFQVMLRALSAVDKWFVGREKHLAYGMVNLASGKMSSRMGEVVTFDWLLSEVKKRVTEVMNQSATSKQIQNEERKQVIDIVSVGAIKFTMLKYALQTNITFDIEKSVSLVGDSGSYLQYTYARAKSVLRTASFNYQPELELKIDGLEAEERSLLQKLEHFDSFVEEAAQNLSPNTITEFLLNLSRDFNLFYQKHPIIKAEEGKVEFRLALTCAVAVTLKQGLYLLGIEAPEQM